MAISEKSRKIQEVCAVGTVTLVVCVIALRLFLFATPSTMRTASSPVALGGPPVGLELSTVMDVSIVRIPPTNARGMSSGGGQRKAHLDAQGIDLLSAIGMTVGSTDPIVVLRELPDGEYNVVARTEEGGKKKLTEMICQALTEGTDCSVTRRLIEIDVIVLSCANRQALTLADGTRERGFYQHDQLPGRPMRTRFSTTLDLLAWHAGYMSRNTACQNKIPNRNALLQKVFVNETRIDGIFQGAVDWDTMDPTVIEASLKSFGLKLTTAKRTVPAIVVEAKKPGQKWSYLHGSGEEEEKAK